MKSFKEYISEDIEVFSGDLGRIPGVYTSLGVRKARHEREAQIRNDPNYEHIDHGPLKLETGPQHPSQGNYSLHQFVSSDPHMGGEASDLTNHEIYIVHNPSDRIVGYISALGLPVGSSRKPELNTLRIDGVEIDPAHRERRTGHSLAIAAYRALNNAGHGIRSSSLQTFGGAKLWEKLRKDPDLSSRMHLHDPTSGTSTPARHLTGKQIWGTEATDIPRGYSVQPETDPDKFEKMVDSYLHIRPPNAK